MSKETWWEKLADEMSGNAMIRRNMGEYATGDALLRWSQRIRTEGAREQHSELSQPLAKPLSKGVQQKLL